ncbi:cytochrome-c peroxidase [Planctomicrobium sp. SH664]|uniref:cytochrome-c peroxidase n=1 Tax=Planctomicrobium sp. SH664 TaxID=3448125 RepID=UPI003F5AF8C1
MRLSLSREVFPSGYYLQYSSDIAIVNIVRVSIRNLSTVLFNAVATLLVAVIAVRADEPSVPSDAAAEKAAPAPVATPPRTTRIQGRSGFFERVPARPVETPEQLRERTQKLREQYQSPPAEWPAPFVDEGVQWTELGPLPAPQHPESNAPSRKKISLGMTLFFDPRVSHSGEMACASCHDPDLGWADGKTVSFGLGRSPLRRNAPSVMNAGLSPTLFWDGRAVSLEDQAVQVLTNPEEMGSSEELLETRLSAIPEYREAFAEVFGDSEVTLERVAQALACFERTLVGGRSPFDAFLRGKHEQLSDSAIRGLDLFRREARCLNCHHGPLLTDHQFHDVGLSYYGRKYEDLGRYAITQAAEDVGKFRTPTLRNVARTQPSMHNGLFDLDGVLRMYNMGMPTLTPKVEQQDDPLFPKKSPLLKPLGLNAQDLEDLEAFLAALSEPRSRIRPPRLPGITAESQESASESLDVSKAQPASPSDTAP